MKKRGPDSIEVESFKVGILIGKNDWTKHMFCDRVVTSQKNSNSALYKKVFKKFKTVTVQKKISRVC